MSSIYTIKNLRQYRKRCLQDDKRKNNKPIMLIAGAGDEEIRHNYISYKQDKIEQRFKFYQRYYTSDK